MEKAWRIKVAQAIVNRGKKEKGAGMTQEALAQTQEPVAWVSEDVCEGQYIDGRPRKIWWECEKGVGTAFYTRPQRTWVGLTVEEIAACCMESTTTQLSFYNAIEAKLKEKNT
jgi:hypothetical protein